MLWLDPGSGAAGVARLIAAVHWHFDTRVATARRAVAAELDGAAVQPPPPPLLADSALSLVGIPRGAAQQVLQWLFSLLLAGDKGNEGPGLGRGAGSAAVPEERCSSGLKPRC
jgi:hypothetical protein